MGLTRRGWATLAAGAVWAVVAVNVGQRDLLWPGLFLCLLPLASRLLLHPGRPSLERELGATRVGVGDELTVRLRLSSRINPGPLLQVREQLSPALGEAGWVEATGAGRRGQLQLDYEVRPAWRGAHQIGPLEYRVQDLLGLSSLKRRLGGTNEVLVVPQVFALADLSAASGVGRADASSQLRTGLASSDDVIVREYQFGDEVRRIHWRSSAHAGKLMVRREERSWDPSATVLLDNRARSYSHQRPDLRLEWAVSAAASLGVHLHTGKFAVRLVEASGVVLKLPAGAAGRELLLDRLARLEPEPVDSVRLGLSRAQLGAGGQLLVAILGSVSEEDVVAMTESARHGTTGWVILVADPDRAEAAAEMIRRAGWQCIVSAPDASPADAWLSLGAGAHA